MICHANESTTSRIAAGRPLQRRRGVRRGAAIVEMAFCVPVFFTVVLGIVEFSRALQLQHTVRQAALEGARAGLTLDGTAATATSAATAVTAAVGIVNPTVTVTPNPIAYTSPTVTVTVSADPSKNGWLLYYFAAGKPISGTITMNREIQAISAQ
jgi:Flp pilus assembly protein TadG